MRYSDISPAMRSFLGGWRAFRQLGFKSDDIYMMVAMSARMGTLNCFVVLKTQGKEFLLEIGPIDTDVITFEKEYVKVTTAGANGEISLHDLDRIYSESEACQKPVGFTNAVLAKGFVLPSLRTGTSAPSPAPCPLYSSSNKKGVKKAKRKARK